MRGKLQSDIVARLSIDDRRTVALAPEVATHLISNPSDLPSVISILNSPDPGLQMHSADALERVSEHHADLLKPFSGQLLEIMVHAHRQEVQWHLLQIMPRIPLVREDVAAVVRIAGNWFTDSPSRIVRVFAMQCVYDLSLTHQHFEDEAAEMISQALTDPAPSLRSRAKKLAHNPSSR